jgi:hypothetical protein
MQDIENALKDAVGDANAAQQAAADAARHRAVEERLSRHSRRVSCERPAVHGTVATRSVQTQCTNWDA